MCDGPESEFARKDLRNGRTKCGREKVGHRDAAVEDDSLSGSCSRRKYLPEKLPNPEFLIELDLKWISIS